MTVHATCVAWDGRGVLITGKSGAGKSGLALMLMGLGCGLVADDRVTLSATDGDVIATCPPALQGLIEARGIGILNAAATGPVPLALVVDLDQRELERMPPRRSITLSGCALPLIHGQENAHFAAAILQLLKAGWSHE